jgi:hypothetical protein
VIEMRRSKRLSALRAMQILAFLPLLLPISISGCLPLYHALREGNPRTEKVASPLPDARAETSVSPGHTPTLKSVHFCGVCAFTKGMNGAFLVSGRQILPPSLASSALAVANETIPLSSPLHPVSRAPPAPIHL